MALYLPCFFNNSAHACKHLINKFIHHYYEKTYYLDQAKDYWDECNPHVQDKMIHHTLSYLKSYDREMAHYIKRINRGEMSTSCCDIVPPETYKQKLRDVVQKFVFTIHAVKYFKPKEVYPIDYSTYNKAVEVLNTPAEGLGKSRSLMGRI